MLGQGGVDIVDTLKRLPDVMLAVLVFSIVQERDTLMGEMGNLMTPEYMENFELLYTYVDTEWERRGLTIDTFVVLEDDENLSSS